MFAWITYFAMGFVETLGYMIFADTFMESNLREAKLHSIDGNPRIEFSYSVTVMG